MPRLRHITTLVITGLYALVVAVLPAMHVHSHGAGESCCQVAFGGAGELAEHAHSHAGCHPHCHAHSGDPTQSQNTPPQDSTPAGPHSPLHDDDCAACKLHLAGHALILAGPQLAGEILFSDVRTADNLATAEKVVRLHHCRAPPCLG